MSRLKTNGIPVATAVTPTSDGHWVSSKVASLIELIQQYDRNIEVRWIPPKDRDPGWPAFKLVEHRNGGEYDMFYVNSEAEFDESVLERVFRMDAMKNGDMLAAMDAKNAAVKASKLKEDIDAKQEFIEFAHTVIKSPKHDYRHEGRRLDLPGAPLAAPKIHIPL